MFMVRARAAIKDSWFEWNTTHDATSPSNIHRQRARFQRRRHSYHSLTWEDHIYTTLRLRCPCQFFSSRGLVHRFLYRITHCTFLLDSFFLFFILHPIFVFYFILISMLLFFHNCLMFFLCPANKWRTQPVSCVYLNESKITVLTFA